MIPGAANPLLLASAQAGAAYNIERCVRFNPADSAYLSRTPSVAGNRKTWTWAGWVKRGLLGVNDQCLFGCSGASGDTTYLTIRFAPSTSPDSISISSSITNFRVTNAVFRDPSAWYHILVAFDSTQASDANRCLVYVNGVSQGFASSSAFTQNADYGINQAVAHSIGRTGGYFSGYLADIHFIDGQALDPTSFGEFDANGVWQPKAYTGSYGTNGFHLPFSDNSTAAALGTDTSGNGNDWTTHNLSVAAGAGNDSLVDTPTSYGTDTGAGGEVRGNYATLNGLKTSYTGGTVSLTNGNLDLSVSMTANQISVPATIGVSTGKWYWEVLCNSITKQYGYDGTIGVSSSGDVNNGTANPSTNRTYVDDGNFWNGSTGSAYGASWTAGDVIGVALDLDAGTLVFYKNGASQGQAISGLTGTWFPVIMSNNVVSFTANWGARPFAYPAPSGFKALCTTNLPEPQTITTSGSYTGNGLADGPFVYLNGVPTAMTVNGTAVTFGTHADKLSNGFKLRTTSTTYNQNAATYNYSVTSTGPTFKIARAQSN